MQFIHDTFMQSFLNIGNWNYLKIIDIGEKLFQILDFLKFYFHTYKTPIYVLPTKWYHLRMSEFSSKIRSLKFIKHIIPSTAHDVALTTLAILRSHMSDYKARTIKFHRKMNIHCEIYTTVQKHQQKKYWNLSSIYYYTSSILFYYYYCAWKRG